ncbi:MAG: hypothetical protein KA132_08290 [Thauera sp.]|nr:hypothetical protein [Thauera sp.]
MEQVESPGTDGGVIEPITPIAEAAGVRTRLDPRSGKQVALQPASFWREHDERRRALGQSIAQYCETHGLALSTFRRWSSRFAGQAHSAPRGVEAAGPSVGDAGFLSVPIRPSDSGHSAAARPVAAIEVQMPSGLKVWLHGPAADRAMEAVMAGLVTRP